ncbi:RNase adapter RapZ [Lacicoccus alkaliphilus]|uniref:UPF0042 nucleotide-binding protein n=1 Tax=Lacicoccus alkaliphilus DSM 16010 TaxID=1123231 RepID=A0A1M7FB34_9BACL|nr:RNase adapter RapZ [Salinicoccus alkaliphilus]SHM01165.1 UPF0042 nucleotide-binding protein [Salinicoccus alkaliphilus DSM 16010]
MKNLIILTGMSGSGKSVALGALEDMNIFCIDNLPPLLIPKIVDLMETTEGGMDNVGLGIDLRGKELFDTLISELEKVQCNHHIDLKIIFLDTTNEKLVTRYKETRRSHPLDHDMNVLQAIQKERELLDELKHRADVIIDTTELKPKELRAEMFEEITGDGDGGFSVNILSFGFKHGVPIDADLMFDVRFLPNPHYIDELQPYTGLDEPVYKYVMGFKETNIFYTKLLDMIRYLLPQYLKEGKSQLVIGIGCTGGQHRSVALAERLTDELREYYDFKIVTEHRDALIEGVRNEQN